MKNVEVVAAVIRKDNKVVAHAATGGENEKVARAL